MARLTVPKTYKLSIGGAFPRTESGRSLAIHDGSGRIAAHICHASRKDLRAAVEAATSALAGWRDATAYLRGQMLYRMAEMLEGRRDEFAAALAVTSDCTAAVARREVDASIDRLVHFAGWTDKFQQVLGCQNPVAGSYYNFTVPQSIGVVAVVAPDEPPLLGLITLMGAVMCSGNTVVAVASDDHPLPGAVLGEVCGTSDIPGGVVNILTGRRAELLPYIAEHRQVSGISAANVSKQERTLLERGAAENIKRIRVSRYEDDAWGNASVTASPWAIEPFVDMKTIWHPSAC